MRTLLVRFVHVFETARLVYHCLLVMTISVILLSGEVITLKVHTILMIHSGMVRDVGVPALAVSSTIHHPLQVINCWDLIELLKEPTDLTKLWSQHSDFKLHYTG